MADAINGPLRGKKHKNLLSKCEGLKRSSVEASMIFRSNSGKITCEFISTYSDFLKALYKQQIYLSRRAKREHGTILPEEYLKDCRQMAERLGLFDLHGRLDELAKEIKQKNIAEALREETYLLKADKKLLRGRKR